MMNEILSELIESALASSVALAIVLLLRRTLRLQYGSVLAYAAWLLVPVSMIATLVPAETIALPRIVLPSALQLPVLQSSGESPARSIDPVFWLLLVWGVGAVLVAGRLARLQLNFVKGLGNTTKANDVLRAESTAGCPVLIGMLRPRIVVPSDFDVRYTEHEKILILAHEKIHLRRGDIHANAFCAALRCVFWFNPLLQVAVNAFRFDQELACDAAVVRRYPDSRRPYAEAMLKTHMADAGLPIGCHWQSNHPLKERIMTLKRPLPNRASKIYGRLSIAALTIAVGYGAWAAQPANTTAATDSARLTAQDEVNREKLVEAQLQLQLAEARYEVGRITSIDLEKARLAYTEALGRATPLEILELKRNLAARQLEQSEKRFEVGLITAAQLDEARLAYDKVSNEYNSTRRSESK